MENPGGGAQAAARGLVPGETRLQGNRCRLWEASLSSPCSDLGSLCQGHLVLPVSLPPASGAGNASAWLALRGRP